MEGDSVEFCMGCRVSVRFEGYLGLGGLVVEVVVL